MSIESVSVLPGNFNAVDNTLEMQIGPFGCTVDMDEFRAIAAGNARELRAVIRNAAIYAGESGWNGDPATLAKVLAGATFKY